VKQVAVLDRAFSFGAMGALYNDVAAALVPSERRPVLANYIYGLGGRDVTVEQILQAFAEVKTARPATGLRYLGLRE